MKLMGSFAIIHTSHTIGMVTRELKMSSLCVNRCNKKNPFPDYLLMHGSINEALCHYLLDMMNIYTSCHQDTRAPFDEHSFGLCQVNSPSSAWL